MHLPSPLAVYPLDDTRKRTDISGERNPPANLGKVTYGEGPDGRQYGSTQFSGRSDSYVEVPNTGKLDPKYSITVLVDAYKERRSSGCILSYNSAGKGFQVRIISPRRLEVEMFERKRRTRFSLRTSKRVIEDKAWNSIGVTYSEKSQKLTIWVNAEAVAFKASGKVQLDTKYPIRLGSCGRGKYFRGRLFCLQLYGVALSGKQMKEARKKCFLKGKNVFSLLTVFSLRIVVVLFHGNR